MKTDSSKDSFLIIQLWRALAAAIVLFGHTQHEAITIAKNAGTIFDHIVFPTGVGVDIFFVISGFVIVYASQSLIGGSYSDAKEFLIRRLIRIVPTYWIFTSLMIGILIIGPNLVQSTQFEWPHAIMSYAFIPHSNPQNMTYPLLSLGWTLNYEMYFYIIFAILIFLPLKRLIGALTLFFVITALIWPFIPSAFIALKFWFSPMTLEFLAGALLAGLWIKGFHLPRWTLYPLIILAFFMLYSLHEIPKDMELLKFTMRGMVAVIFVVSATLPAQAQTIKPPKMLHHLGDSSYALYLSHPFAIGFCTFLWSKITFFTSLNLWIYITATMILAIIGAHIFYLIIERPITRFLKSWTRKQS